MPFLASLQGGAKITELASVLPVAPRTASDDAPTPWTPRREASSADTRAHDDALAAARAEAVASGRAEGLAETAVLRARLATLCEALGGTHATKLDELALAIGGAAAAAVEAWAGASDRAALFTPVVRGWLGSPSGSAPAIARVNPADVEALRDALGPAAPATLVVQADAAVRPGDVAVRGAEHELVQCWQNRVAELREAIAAAVQADRESARDVQVA